MKCGARSSMLCSRELPARSLRRRCGDEGGAAIACPVFPAPAPRRGRGALTRTGHVVGAVWGSQANPINQTYTTVDTLTGARFASDMIIDEDHVSSSQPRFLFLFFFFQKSKNFGIHKFKRKGRIKRRILRKLIKMNNTTNTQPLDLSAVVYLAIMITVFFAAV